MVMAPFFGTAARTSTLICRLAQRAPVIFVSATHLDNGYHISYLAAPQALYDKDPQVSAPAVNQMFEQMICRGLTSVFIVVLAKVSMTDNSCGVTTEKH